MVQITQWDHVFGPQGIGSGDLKHKQTFPQIRQASLKAAFRGHRVDALWSPPSILRCLEGPVAVPKVNHVRFKDAHYHTRMG